MLASMVRLMAPEKTYQAMCELTQEILNANEWQSIQKQLGSM
jgi:hypothetical protein